MSDFGGGFIRPRGESSDETRPRAEPLRERPKETATPHPSQPAARPRVPLSDMLITTTSTLDGRRIEDYLGLVSGDAILGANFVSDFFAKLSDFVGGRVHAYERTLAKAKEEAITQMVSAAAAHGANAVIGVDLDYEIIQVEKGGSMLMVSANGTAVLYR